MAGSSPGKIVAGLTALALAGVGFLAYQAAASAPEHPGKSRPSTSATPDGDKPGGRHKKKPPPAVPAASGTGLRVVYSLSDQRVWLVGADEQPLRTFEVAPSTVSPPPGEYTVFSRTAATTGSDGVPIENVVLFTAVEGVVVGFSAAVDGSTPVADPNLRTGGIREGRADGSAMWKFATEDTKVVVVD
ncbi:hypothetical protein [Streptomyces sp. TP-A0874]|uniref:hypothetical protein n=1 Tax=Streptomyces sp. TP-A0874 TaxID=549819 RepID=UPI000AAB5321|nr:hypothetical protein [Streptomyces sp. TP-A0874]